MILVATRISTRSHRKRATGCHRVLRDFKAKGSFPFCLRHATVQKEAKGSKWNSKTVWRFHHPTNTYKQYQTPGGRCPTAMHLVWFILLYGQTWSNKVQVLQPIIERTVPDKIGIDWSHSNSSMIGHDTYDDAVLSEPSVQSSLPQGQLRSIRLDLLPHQHVRRWW